MDQNPNRLSDLNAIRDQFNFGDQPVAASAPSAPVTAPIASQPGASDRYEKGGKRSQANNAVFNVLKLKDTKADVRFAISISATAMSTNGKTIDETARLALLQVQFDKFLATLSSSL